MKKILSYTLVWRLLLLLIPLLVIPISQIFTIWGNFDGIRFLNLAKEGYGTPSTFYSYSLFPFYPHLIRSLSFLGGYLSSGWIISNTCLFLSVIVFWKLLRLDYAPRTCQLALLTLAFFPSSFVLGSVYSESLFLLLTLVSFYLARKDRFILASVFAFFATYTRAVGIFVWLSLIIEYFSQHPVSRKTFFDIKLYALTIPPLGALIYLKYLSVYTSSFINFLPSVPHKLVFLHQVFLRYLRMLIFIDHTSSLFVIVLTELFIGTLVLLIIIFSHKYLRFSYWSYLTLSYLAPSLWGSFVGYPRYMVVVFPIFIFLAHWLERSHPYYKYLYFSTSIILLFSNLLLFAQGVFVG